ncbi:hypothetical protein ACFXO7_05060, partial [Nocardia tengchongensis]
RYKKHNNGVQRHTLLTHTPPPPHTPAAPPPPGARGARAPPAPPPDYGLLIRGAAYYHDTYRREDGVWRIATTGYQRIYESKMLTGELPGYALTANRWAPAEENR